MVLVKNWADRYLDSGVSIQTDTEPMSGSDYDSDDSQGTAHHSYSYIPSSELEVSLHDRLTAYVQYISLKQRVVGACIPTAWLNSNVVSVGFRPEI